MTVFKAAEGGPALSLAELEAFDPNAPPPRGKEQRFKCPFPACGDRVNARGYRQISVDVETGAWFCYRCKARGSSKSIGRIAR